MKHLLTAIACCLAVAGSAQTWNPDADFDNVIGVNDLMALLSVFGSEWTAEYPQDPEYDLAAYYVGEVDLFECIRTCTDNHAKIIGLNEFAMFEDSVLAYSEVYQHNTTTFEYNWWIDDPRYSCYGLENYLEVDPSSSSIYDNYSNWSFHCQGNAATYHNSFQMPRSCVCTGLIPAVE